METSCFEADYRCAVTFVKRQDNVKLMCAKGSASTRGWGMSWTCIGNPHLAAAVTLLMFPTNSDASRATGAHTRITIGYQISCFHFLLQ
jgi:hypothetical protein